MHALITAIEATSMKKILPDFRVGDIVRVHQRIAEGGKERIQVFEGIVLAKKHGTGMSGTFTVRRIASGVGVERIFPVHSPAIAKIERLRSSHVRRAKLYFLRGLFGKKAKLKGFEDYASWSEPEATEPETGDGKEVKSETDEATEGQKNNKTEPTAEADEKEGKSDAGATDDGKAGGAAGGAVPAPEGPSDSETKSQK